MAATKQIAELDKIIISVKKATETIRAQEKPLYNPSHPYIQKLQELEQAISALRKAPKKEKESVQCSYCDKKFINIGSHVYQMHTCAFCKDATVRDHDAHDLVCKEWIKYKKYKKEFGIRKGWTYIDDDKYIVFDGNVFTNYYHNSSTRKFYEFVGRIRSDGTIDKTAKRTVKVVIESESGQCSYCDNKYGDMKGHIHEAHTCPWCNDATIKHMDTHIATCADYIKWDSDPLELSPTTMTHIDPFSAAIVDHFAAATVDPFADLLSF
jgi:aerobic-type carbon monoxide dehydrogenase small subunit (CoxS/CutS family)